MYSSIGQRRQSPALASTTRRCTIRSTLVGLLVLAVAATAASAADTPINIPKPSRARKMTLPLVRAYDKCTNVNSYWETTAPVGACVPPTTSSMLEFGPNGWGSITFQVVKVNNEDYNLNGTPDSPNDADIVVTLRLYDVRNVSDGSPYSGPMSAVDFAHRWTTTDCAPVGGDRSCTLLDHTSFGGTVNFPGQQCTSGRCKLVGSQDAFIFGLVEDGTTSSIDFSPGWSGDHDLRVVGPDGVAFAVPGLVVP